MKENIGILTVDAPSWCFRHECFSVKGGDGHVPLVNETFDSKHDMPRFAVFLSAGFDRSFLAACGKVGGTSPMFRSVGKRFEDQVRALRYRSIFNAVINLGWKALRACLDHGYTADYFFCDPVFERVEHKCVLEDIAMRIVNDRVPWNRGDTTTRLMEFFHGDYAHMVAHVLTMGNNLHLQLFLWDRLFPDQFVTSYGRSALMAAFWRFRKDEFDDLCARFGVRRDIALYEVLELGAEDAIEALLAVEDPSVRKMAFVRVWNNGDIDSATRLAHTLTDPDVSFASPGFSLALKACLRIHRLENIISALLLEKARVTC